MTAVANLEKEVAELEKLNDEAEEKLRAAEDDARELKALLDEVKDGTATLLQYKERAEAAAERERLAWAKARDCEVETAAMRKRKGIEAGLFKCRAEVFALLRALAGQSHGSEHKAAAEKIMEQIGTA